MSGIETGVTEIDTWWNYEKVNYIKFTLDNVHYMAYEDPSDGYRSYLSDLKIDDKPCKIKFPNVDVVCKMREDDYYERNDVLEFYDTQNNKLILAIGTGNTGDYYPYCVVEYKPENMSCNN